MIAATGIADRPARLKRVGLLIPGQANGIGKQRQGEPLTPLLNAAIVNEKDAETIPRSITLLQFQILR